MKRLYLIFVLLFSVSAHAEEADFAAAFLDVFKSNGYKVAYSGIRQADEQVQIDGFMATKSDQAMSFDSLIVDGGSVKDDSVSADRLTFSNVAVSRFGYVYKAASAVSEQASYSRVDGSTLFRDVLIRNSTIGDDNISVLTIDVAAFRIDDKALSLSFTGKVDSSVAKILASTLTGLEFEEDIKFKGDFQITRDNEKKELDVAAVILAEEYGNQELTMNFTSVPQTVFDAWESGMARQAIQSVIDEHSSMVVLSQFSYRLNDAQWIKVFLESAELLSPGFRTDFIELIGNLTGMAVASLSGLESAMIAKEKIKGFLVAPSSLMIMASPDMTLDDLSRLSASGKEIKIEVLVP